MIQNNTQQNTAQYMPKQFSGKISAIMFNEPESGYAIFKIRRDEDGKSIIAKGTVPNPIVGAKITYEGKWERDPKRDTPYISITKAHVDYAGGGYESIIGLLSSDYIPGLGQKVAERIVLRFGEETLNVIENDPERLQEVKGIGAKSADKIHNAYLRIAKDQEVISMLIPFISIQKITAILKKFGSGKRAMEEIQDNPYVLYQKLSGIGFATADRIALGACSLQRQDIRRVTAIVLYTLEYEAQMDGHSFIWLPNLLGCVAKAAQKAANRAGATKEGDRDSQSITDKGARSKEAKDYSNGKQAASESDTGRTDHNNVSHEKGSSIGQPDLGAATMDLKSIENQRKIEAATEQANEELNAQLKKEAAEMRKTVGTRLEVTRAEKVSDSNVATYKRLSSDLLGVTKNLERRLKTVIRDEENDDAVAGLPMGSRVEARLAYHQDGKIFSRKNFPRDNPRLAVGYLCDESGSMSGSAIQASVRTGIIIQDLCERMELPCYICGYTTASNYGGTQILEYVDQDIDGKDKYRITGMASRGGTPTMPAMRYMGEKLRREQAEKRLLIVSTDGCSDGGRESIQQVIKDLRKKYNIIVIGAGIGASRGSVENEFGDNFIDISNLETMPRVLCNIVKKNLL